MADARTPSQFTSPEQQAAYRSANIRGGLTGIALATGVSVPSYLILNSRSNFYRSLPIAAKAFGFVVIGVPFVFISAEKAGEAYDRSTWTGAGKRELDMVEERERQRWDSLGFGEKFGDWGRRNRYGIIGSA